MPDISILIPTANRPQFLTNSLVSVARQSLINRIAEVVVMENGGNRASEQICKRFPQLPIRYVYRKSQIPHAGLMASWFGEARFPIVAMLHDDDWWVDFHLARGVSSLEQNSDAVAAYSSCCRVADETAWTMSLYGSFIAWFADATAPAGGLRKLSFEQVLLASLLATGFHMSSLIAFKSAIEASLENLHDGNEFDVDRSLAVEFSLHGKLLFSDTPSVFVRIHPGQDSGTAAVNSFERIWFPRTTRRLLNLARDSSIEVRSRLAERFTHLGLDFYAIADQCTETSLDTLYAESLLPASMVNDYRINKRNTKIRRQVRSLRNLVQRFKSKLGS